MGSSINEGWKPAARPYRRITALLGPDAAAESRLRLAVSAAQRFGDGVRGLYLSPLCDGAADPNGRLQDQLTGLARDCNVEAEWAVVCGSQDRLLETAISESRLSDLVIAGHVAGESAYRLIRDTGRPVVFSPGGQSAHTFGDRVTVAWDGSREAARAVGDALPLLRSARDVVILSVDSARADPNPAITAGADIADYLGLHGVPVRLRQSYVAGAEIGRTILSRAKEIGSDLVVMGASGGSHARRVSLGGATTHVLENLTLPVLMSC